MEGALTGRATPSLGSGGVCVCGVYSSALMGGVAVSLEYTHLRKKQNKTKQNIRTKQAWWYVSYENI